MPTARAVPQGYETKSAEYFQETRPEMLQFIPAKCRRLLDVGCGEGGFGESVKRTREVEVWGVEPVTSAAEKASRKLDHVINAAFNSETGLPLATFDCIAFNDVLEHMVEPEEALQQARALLAPGGVVVASIPNIRTVPAIWDLLVHGSWEYRDCGLFDRTHLRFFTRSSIAKLFQSQGFVLETIRGINAYVGIPNASKLLWTAFKVSNAICAGKMGDMRFQQFAVVARLAASYNLQSD